MKIATPIIDAAINIMIQVCIVCARRRTTGSGSFFLSGISFTQPTKRNINPNAPGVSR